MMLSREEFVDFLEDHEGMVGNAELADPLDETEAFVRAAGRQRGVKRVGSVMVWSTDDALALYDELAAEAEEDEDLDDFEDEDLDDLEDEDEDLDDLEDEDE